MERNEQLGWDERTLGIKKRFILGAAPALASATLRAFAGSCSFELRGREHFEKVVADHGHVIIAFWHETLGIAAWHHRNVGFYTLTSQSFDGELAARLVKRMGFHVVRGSSSRGGAVAMNRLQEVLQNSPGFGFTVDGPKGPRRVAKAGIAYLSARTGVPVLPQAFVAQPAWRVNSWDRLAIPKPFGRIVSAYGPAIPPAPDCSRAAIEDARLRIEQAINALHADLEDALPSTPTNE